MKRTVYTFVMLALAVMLVAGCAGNKSTSTVGEATDDMIKDIPEWMSPP